MKLGKNCGSGQIVDLDTWFKYAPPMGGEKQWKDGRSAKELARFLTANYPNIPHMLSDVLKPFTSAEAEFTWAGEYETSFAKHNLGRGTGRNHDAILYNKDIFVGIEAKADEPFGDKYLGEEFENASDNKKKRILGLTTMIFGDEVEKHRNLRYQLLTACGGTLLEAKEKGTPKAMVLILVFKKEGCYTQENDSNNQQDLNVFLSEAGARFLDNGCYEVPTSYGKQNGIYLYLKKIDIII